MNNVSFCAGVPRANNIRITKAIADQYYNEAELHKAATEVNTEAAKLREAVKAKYLSSEKKLIKHEVKEAPNVGPEGSFFG